MDKQLYGYPEEFPEELGAAPTIHGDVEPYQGVRA